MYLPAKQMAADPKLAKDLFLQATDGSQCVSWTGSQVGQRFQTSCHRLTLQLTVQLTYLGRECKEIPSILIQLYASAATRIDLSYCCLHTLKGLEAFKNLQEVVLDNNCLTDGTFFPPSTSVTTLSLNKNGVSSRSLDEPKLFTSVRVQFERIDCLLRQLSFSYPKLHFLSLLGNPGYPDHITRDSDDSHYKRYRFVRSFCLRPH